MDHMIEMLQALEQRVWKKHTTVMPNERYRQLGSSYAVHYEFGIGNNVGSVFLLATKDNRLCISVFHGIDPDGKSNIYATPDIYKIATAERMLKKIEDIIDDSAYEGCCTDIELVAQEIKKEFDNCR